MTLQAAITMDVHQLGRGIRQELRDDVRRGLAAEPRTLSPKWFYDDLGCELFDRITRLPEYYQTRTEAAILRDAAPDIVRRTNPVRIVEVGSGTCDKTRILLDAAWRHGTLESFTAFDVSATVVHDSAVDLVERYPGLRVHGIVGDFAAHLDGIPARDQQLVAFLGSTIGNLDDAERGLFFAAVRSRLLTGSAFLLGIDLVKDAHMLVEAYDDAEGVTAAFNRNVLAVINRELLADFDPGSFEHVAAWNDAAHRIEMHLRSRGGQRVSIPEAGMKLELRDGETIRTEISVKFTEDLVRTELTTAGLVLDRWYSDVDRRFALALARPRD
ncbi:MAG: L-histidine N(alpha)-methyltransferase [Candidatus Dormibacteraeota bacterium]|nr:L-histidine N(alpha)-methyltransferase [Candidatus Dormibacteraeota bacterium]